MADSEATPASPGGGREDKPPRLPLATIVQDIPLNRQVMYPRLLALAVLTAVGGVAALTAPLYTRGLSMSVWNFLLCLILLGSAYGLWWLALQWAPTNASTPLSMLWAGSKNPVATLHGSAQAQTSAQDLNDATIRRVAQILRIEPPTETESGYIYPNNEYEIINVQRFDPNDSRSDIKSFTILTTVAGSFGIQRNQEQVIEAIRNGLPKGKLLWDNRIDAAQDMIVFSRKKEFPKAIFPPLPYKIARSPQEANSLFEDNPFLPFGEDAYGKQIGVRNDKQPHGFVIGGSGSGKTVYFSQAIEYLRARGAMVMLLDGKFASFTPYITAPNIIFTAMDALDLLWGLAWAQRQMEARYSKIKNAGKEYARAQQEGRAHSGDSALEPPLYIILDELDVARDAVLNKFGKKVLESMMASIANILALGRQSRVYLLIGNQSYYSTTLDGQSKSNISYKITLGEVEPRTLQDAFSKENAAEAKRMSEAIPKNSKGRGVQEVTEMDENGNETGNKIISEFLTYYGFHLAELKPPTWEPAKTEWARFKEQVVDRIPQLYPHFAYERPYPNDAENLGDTDLTMDDVFDTLGDNDNNILSLLKYKPVALDHRNGDTGAWEYIADPSISRYNQLSDNYVANTGRDLSDDLINY